MAVTKLFLAATVSVGLTASAIAAFAPAAQKTASAVLISDVPQRMAVVHKMPGNPFDREITEERCRAFECQEI